MVGPVASSVPSWSNAPHPAFSLVGRSELSVPPGLTRRGRAVSRSRCTGQPRRDTSRATAPLPLRLTPRPPASSTPTPALHSWSSLWFLRAVPRWLTRRNHRRVKMDRLQKGLLVYWSIDIIRDRTRPCTPCQRNAPLEGGRLAPDFRSSGRRTP